MQEALTNVVRHAGARTAVVSLGYRADGLTIEVADDGRGAGGPMSRPDGGTVRVLLADDQHLVRAGFRLVLERDDRIEVVGEAADGAEAVGLARRLRPDVVLMDVRIPVLDGLEATRRIVEDARTADVRVVMLTTFELDDSVFDGLRAGASGFLLKEIEPEELRQAVHLVADGHALLSPKSPGG